MESREKRPLERAWEVAVLLVPSGTAEPSWSEAGSMMTSGDSYMNTADVLCKQTGLLENINDCFPVCLRWGRETHQHTVLLGNVSGNTGGGRVGEKRFQRWMSSGGLKCPLFQHSSIPK